MTWPKVSVLWLNFNTMHILPFVKKVLISLSELDYPNYEVVIVDNASSDGSWEILRDFARTHVARKVETKILRLSRNYGFAGGYNAAYAARDPESKYVVLVNTDAIPVRELLKRYVEFMERHTDVGAAQGIVLGFSKYREKVDSAGGMIDILLKPHFPLRGRNYRAVLEVLTNKPYIEVSYVEGTMPIYRVEAVEKVNHFPNRLYVTAGFMYYLEDILLSSLLWTHGYKCVLIPFIVGYHIRKIIIRRYVNVREKYYSIRNKLALASIVKPSTCRLLLLKYLRAAILGSRNGRVSLRIIVDGLRLGSQLRKNITWNIDIRKMPHRRLGAIDILKRIL